MKNSHDYAGFGKVTLTNMGKTIDISLQQNIINPMTCAYICLDIPYFKKDIFPMGEFDN